MATLVSTPGTTLVVLYVLACAAIAFAVAKPCAPFSRVPFAATQRQLAWLAAFVVVVPIGVLLHEFGHAVATWVCGGEVLELKWRGLWGSVVRTGELSPLESWWIALSGNLVSVALGLTLLAAAAFGKGLRPVVAYLLFAAGMLELLNTAAVAPLVTLVGGGVYGDSDWRQIYDFAATPLPSALIALAHAGLLVLLWMKRERLAEMAWAIEHAAWPELSKLRAAIAAWPQAVELRIELARLFRSRNESDRFEAAMREALRQCGEDPALYTALAEALLAQHRHADAVAPLSRGLELEDVTPSLEQCMRGHLGVALAGSDRAREALAAFAQLREPLASDPVIERWREHAERGLAKTGRPHQLVDPPPVRSGGVARSFVAIPRARASGPRRVVDPLQVDRRDAEACRARAPSASRRHPVRRDPHDALRRGARLPGERRLRRCVAACLVGETRRDVAGSVEEFDPGTAVAGHGEP